MSIISSPALWRRWLFLLAVFMERPDLTHPDPASFFMVVQFPLRGIIFSTRNETRRLPTGKSPFFSYFDLLHYKSINRFITRHHGDAFEGNFTGVYHTLIITKMKGEMESEFELANYIKPPPTITGHRILIIRKGITYEKTERVWKNNDPFI